MIKHINAAKVGNQRAYTYLVDKNKNMVYGFVLQKCKNEKLAQEVTFEAFFKGFNKLATYESHKSEFSTWLIAIAKNTLFDKQKKSNKSKLIFTDEFDSFSSKYYGDTVSSVEEKIMNTETEAYILKLLESLSETYKTILQLRYYKNLSYDEIAEEISMPLSTVKIRLSRAKQALKMKYEGYNA